MSTSAHNLPPEIWLQIIDWVRFNAIPTLIADYTTLKNLSAVSSPLRSVAQPELFASLDINTTVIDYGPLETRLDGLLDLFKNRPESTCWIKRFACQGRGEHADHTAFWHRVSSLFIQLQALIRISLTNLPITLSMISHVHRLSNLRFLHVSTNVSLAPEIRASEDADVHLTTPIVPPDFDPQEKTAPLSVPASLVIAPTIRSLSINGPGPMQIILDAIHAQPTFKFSHISSLSLSTDFNVHSLFDYPQLFPNLIHLSLIPYGTAPSSPISGFQNLQEFRGNYFTAALVVPGRPIKELVIYSRGDPVALSKESISSLSSGSTQLLKLTVYSATWRDGCLVDIAELLPGLTFLALYQTKGDCMAWLEGRLSTELRGLSVLHTLHLTISDYPEVQKELPEDRRKAMLNELKSPNLSLREVQIGRTLWRGDHLCCWRPTNQLVFW